MWTWFTQREGPRTKTLLVLWRGWGCWWSQTSCCSPRPSPSTPALRLTEVLRGNESDQWFGTGSSSLHALFLFYVLFLLPGSKTTNQLTVDVRSHNSMRERERERESLSVCPISNDKYFHKCKWRLKWLCLVCGLTYLNPFYHYLDNYDTLAFMPRTVIWMWMQTLRQAL